jgi:hypothetical protein
MVLAAAAGVVVVLRIGQLSGGTFARQWVPATPGTLRKLPPLNFNVLQGHISKLFHNFLSEFFSI